jgi:hypothetical protein
MKVLIQSNGNRVSPERTKPQERHLRSKTFPERKSPQITVAQSKFRVENGNDHE